MTLQRNAGNTLCGCCNCYFCHVAIVAIMVVGIVTIATKVLLCKTKTMTFIPPDFSSQAQTEQAKNPYKRHNSTPSWQEFFIYLALFWKYSIVCCVIKKNVEAILKLIHTIFQEDSMSDEGNNSANAPPPPPTAAGRPPTSLLFSRGNLTSSRGDRTAYARPSTAVRGVGYAADSASASQRFDQRFLEKAKQQTLSSANAAIDVSEEINPQIKYKNLENKITMLLESSIELASQAHHKRQSVNSVDANNAGSDTIIAQIKSMFAEALNKAKEAFSLDRTLHRFRDQNGENIFHNFDLTYAVFFNLAEQYENNELYIEALNTYGVMTKNKMFPHVNQLKLNMGNIYFKMGIYGKAIKMYRMALDSVPNNLKQLRFYISLLLLLL